MNLQELAAAYSEQLVNSKVNNRFSREQVIEHLLKGSEERLLLAPVQHEALMQLQINGHMPEHFHDFNVCCRNYLFHLYEEPLRKISHEERTLAKLFLNDKQLVI